MKKIIFFAAVILIMLIPTAYADDISIIINGNELQTENEPVIINDRTLVPMRAIFEGVGAWVSWDDENREVSAELNHNAVKIQIDSPVLYTGIVNSDGVNIFSSKKTIDVPAMIIDDRTYVPARAVSEAFGFDVGWDDENRRVIINSLRESDNYFYYASADDYSKLYRVDSNGIKREKICDIPIKELYYDNGYVYYITDEGYLYRYNGQEEQLTSENTEILSINGRRIFYKCGDTVYEHGKKSWQNILNPEHQGDYLYYNKSGDAKMYALNLNTYEETFADMGYGIMLAPYNCVFYGGYILVEDGVYYHNIYRFDADGSNKTVLNSNNSFICRHQEEDERILYINGDMGQDIYYVWIDGSYVGEVADLPPECAYADVLMQKGDFIYYKNMYRKEIYRTNFDATENIYVGYGDKIDIHNDMLIISGDGLYIGNLNGENQREVYDHGFSEFFVTDNNIYGRESIDGNIMKVDFNGKSRNITNDRVLLWAYDF